MQAFRTKLGKDGRIIIPVDCRRILHLQPGEELSLSINDGILHSVKLR